MIKVFITSMLRCREGLGKPLKPWSLAKVFKILDPGTPDLPSKCRYVGLKRVKNYVV